MHVVRTQYHYKSNIYYMKTEGNNEKNQKKYKKIVCIEIMFDLNIPAKAIELCMRNEARPVHLLFTAGWHAIVCLSV